jgi:nitroreductase/FMN reductase [NAD(P)H]
MQTFIIAAESLGLGCCPVSQVRDHIDALSAELELPQWVFPVAGLCVGWPAAEGRISLRLPLSVTVHEDRFDDSDLMEQVADYDRRREALEQTPPDQQRMVGRFGISEDYGWSENRTRQYAVPAREDFGRYIRDQGFDLS